MTNSYSVNGEELPEQFVHHCFGLYFDNVSFMNNNIVIRQNNIKVIIIIVKNCTSSYPIKKRNMQQSNIATFYMIFNIGAYHDTIIMNDSCFKYNTTGFYNLVPTMESEFLDRIECVKTLVEVIFSYNEHSNQIRIQKIFFSSADKMHETLLHMLVHDSL